MAARSIKLPATWSMGAGGFIGYAQLVDPVEVPRFAPPVPVPARTAVLSVVYVHPLRRGLGWGDSLLRQALAYADRHGAPVASWASPIPEPKHARDGRRLRRLEYERLMAWYESYGFKPIGDTNYIIRKAR